MESQYAYQGLRNRITMLTTKAWIQYQSRDGMICQMLLSYHVNTYQQLPIYNAIHAVPELGYQYQTQRIAET